MESTITPPTAFPAARQQFPWARLRRDRTLWALLGFQALLAFPFLIPSVLPTDWHTLYLYSIADLGLATSAFLAVGWRALQSSRAHPEERRFWFFLAGAPLCWATAETVMLVADAWTSTAHGDAAVDGIYTLSFLCVLFAAETQPHRSPGWTRNNTLQLIRVAGSAVFVGGMFAYFVLAPNIHGDTLRDGWGRSFLLFLTLDAYLMVRFFALRRSAGNSRWQALYGACGLLYLAMLIADSAELQAILTTSDSVLEPSGLLWFVQFSVAVCIARMGQLSAASPMDGESIPDPDAARWPVTEGMFVALAMAIPTIHFSMQWTGILDPELHYFRERVSIAILTTLGGLALAQALLLGKRNRALVRDLQGVSAQLLQAQKMDAVGRLAGGVAHDFNNLLTVIMGHQDTLKSELSADDPRRPSIDGIAASCERASALTTQLLAFSRNHVSALEVLDLDRVIRKFAPLLQRLSGEDVELVIKSANQPGWILADRTQLEQLFLNLAVNAREAMPAGGRLAIETRVHEVGDIEARRLQSLPGDHVEVRISDTGCGMTREVQARIFEPFYTTKSAASGTGLGLSTVYGIVQRCAGHIQVESEQDQGATFVVTFRRVAAPRRKAAPRSLEPGRGTESILLVEDEEAVRAVVGRALVGQGYSVTEAANGDAALKIVQRQQKKFQLLVTDVVMPGLSGPELAARVQGLDPDIRVLYMSGYTGDALTGRGVRQKGIGFIQKPFTSEDLASRVRTVMDSADTLFQSEVSDLEAEA